MLTLAVAVRTWPRLGVIAAALLGGGSDPRAQDVRRAWAMLGALVLAPVLLLDDVWHSSQLAFVHRHPPRRLSARWSRWSCWRRRATCCTAGPVARWRR